MRKTIGLCILVILLLAATGCSQPAPTAPATTTTTVPEATTMQMTTAMPTDTMATTTTEITPTVAMPSVTPVPAKTTVETTETLTPSPVQTPVITAKVIHIKNNSFIPPATTVLPGTGITWINDDLINHAIKSTGVSQGMFNSGDIVPGTSWNNAFGANAAVITYTDPKFPGMNGTIIVMKGLHPS